MRLVRPPNAFPDHRQPAGAAPSLASAVADRADAPPTGQPRADTPRFVVALLLAAGAHIGAAAWMLRSQPPELASNSPPAAIVVEIMEVPEAVRTEMNVITPDQTTSMESAAQQEQKAEETPEKPVEKTPEPEVTKPVEQQATEEKPVPPEKTEDPMPVEQPKPEPPKEEPPKEEPKPEPPKEEPKKEPPKEKSKEKRKDKPKPKKAQKASPDSKAASQAQARTRQSNRNAAARSSSGASSASSATWGSQVLAHLSRHQRYPAGALSSGERATPQVRFTIDASGRVLSVTLARSSGKPVLDQEAVALVRRASPVPAPPPGVDRVVIAPILFRMN